MFFLLTVPPAKLEHFSSKCEACEERSYFRICDSPTEDCWACVHPLTSDAHELLFSSKRKVSYITALMLIGLFTRLIIKMWPPVEQELYIGKRVIMDLKFNYVKISNIFFLFAGGYYVQTTQNQ